MSAVAGRKVLGALALLAVGAALRPVTVLELENPARGVTARIALGDGEEFSVISHHSIYDRPVTEEFRVGAGLEIVLTSVSSPSAAVREYFGIAAPGERHPMERPMKEIVFRVATGTPQRLRLGGLERSFLELGDHGDRLVLRASREPAAVQWLRSTFHS